VLTLLISLQFLRNNLVPHCLPYFLLRRYRHSQANLRVLLHVSKCTTHHIHALASHLHTNLHQFWSSILSRIGGRSVISSLAPLSLQEVNAFSATICDAINNKYWDSITYVLSSIILWFNDPDILVLQNSGTPNSLSDPRLLSGKWKTSSSTMEEAITTRTNRYTYASSPISCVPPMGTQGYSSSASSGYS